MIEGVGDPERAVGGISGTVGAVEVEFRFTGFSGGSVEEVEGFFQGFIETEAAFRGLTLEIALLINPDRDCSYRFDKRDLLSVNSRFG